MGPAAAGAPKKNVTAAAAAKTTTSHRQGWHIVAKITVTINGLQSDLQPGGLSTSHKSEPRAPQELTWAEWGRPCRSPDGTRSAVPPRAERRPAGSLFTRPGRGAPAGPCAVARRRTCERRTCAGRGQVGWRPRPGRASSCSGLPPAPRRLQPFTGTRRLGSRRGQCPTPSSLF